MIPPRKMIPPPPQKKIDSMAISKEEIRNIIENNPPKEELLENNRKDSKPKVEYTPRHVIENETKYPDTFIPAYEDSIKACTLAFKEKIHTSIENALEEFSNAIRVVIAKYFSPNEKGSNTLKSIDLKDDLEEIFQSHEGTFQYAIDKAKSICRPVDETLILERIVSKFLNESDSQDTLGASPSKPEKNKDALVDVIHDVFEEYSTGSEKQIKDIFKRVIHQIWIFTISVIVTYTSALEPKKSPSDQMGRGRQSKEELNKKVKEILDNFKKSSDEIS